MKPDDDQNLEYWLISALLTTCTTFFASAITITVISCTKQGPDWFAWLIWGKGLFHDISAATIIVLATVFFLLAAQAVAASPSADGAACPHTGA